MLFFWTGWVSEYLKTDTQKMNTCITVVNNILYTQLKEFFFEELIKSMKIIDIPPSLTVMRNGSLGVLLHEGRAGAKTGPDARRRPPHRRQPHWHGGWHGGGHNPRGHLVARKIGWRWDIVRGPTSWSGVGVHVTSVEDTALFGNLTKALIYEHVKLTHG